MNQAPTRLRDFRQRRFLIGGFRLQPTKEISKRKNPFQPQINPGRVNNSIVKDNRGEEALSQRWSEHRFDNGGVVPNIERAPENLRDQRRQCCEQKSVTRARRVSFSFDGHRMRSLLVLVRVVAREISNPKLQIPMANLNYQTPIVMNHG